MMIKSSAQYFVCSAPDFKSFRFARQIHMFILFIAAILLCSCWGCGAVIRSQHFTIQNNSPATEQQVQQFASTLEQARTNVEKFLQKEPPDSIFVYLEAGSEIPRTDESTGRMFFYHNRYGINSSAAAHEITHLTTGGYLRSLPFIAEGIAVYADESINPKAKNNFPQFSQPTDAWVKLFRQKGKVLPIWKVFEIKRFNWNLNGSVDDTEAWQMYVEAGSLVRFIVESRGWDAFWKFHDSRNAEAGLGLSLQDLEQEWLEAIDRKEIQYRPCRNVLQQKSARYRFWCKQIDP